MTTLHTPDGQFEFVQDGALGTGACGVVRIAKHVKNGELFAIKVMSVTTRLTEVVKEITAYGRLTGHPYVVQLHSSQVDLDKRRVYLVMVSCAHYRAQNSPRRGSVSAAGALSWRRALRPHRGDWQDGRDCREAIL